MCSTTTPKIQPAAPPPPAPAETADTLQTPTSARDSSAMGKRRKGRAALLIERVTNTVNVPGAGAGVNA